MYQYALNLAARVVESARNMSGPRTYFNGANASNPKSLDGPKTPEL